MKNNNLFNSYMLKSFLKKSVRLLSPYCSFLEKRIILLEKKNKVLSKEIANAKFYNMFNIGENICNDEIIVSLTSYGKRIGNVHLTIASLLHQSIRPNKVILWLAAGENITKELELIDIKFREFEIKYCNDLKSYKKFIPVLDLVNDELVITADDDIIYPVTFISELYNAHKQNPQYINCYRAHRIKFIKGKLGPYDKWDYESNNIEPSHAIVPTTGAGVIFNKYMLDEQCVNYVLANKLCPTADDMWFKIMAVLKGTKCKVIEGNLMSGFIEINEGSDTLSSLNVIGKMNDKYFINLLNYFHIDKNRLIDDSN